MNKLFLAGSILALMLTLTACSTYYDGYSRGRERNTYYHNGVYYRYQNGRYYPNRGYYYNGNFYRQLPPALARKRYDGRNARYAPVPGKRYDKYDSRYQKKYQQKNYRKYKRYDD